MYGYLILINLSFYIMENGIKKKASYYMIAKYLPNEFNKEKAKILGGDFIKRNKNKYKIIYKSKIYELVECFEDIDNKYNHKDLIKIKLIFFHNIIDISYIFDNCYFLISLSAKNKTNLGKYYFKIYYTNLNCMLYGCESLISLLDI